MLASNACVVRLAAFLVALPMALEQAPALARQRHRVIARTCQAGDLNSPVLAEMAQIAGSRIERPIAVVV